MLERYEPGHGEQPRRWHWALPLCPIAAAMFCLSALVYYHTVLGGTGEAWGFFQGLVVGLYHWFGFVPTFMFWLLVFAWCSVWFVTGRFERARVRLAWMATFAISLAILLNIGTDANAPPPHAGVVGTFIAVRLASVLGVVFSSLLALGAALAALLLATDFLFYRYFESLARGGTADAGVEPEATEAFRELAFAGMYADEPRVVAGGSDPAPTRRRVILDDESVADLAAAPAVPESAPPLAAAGVALDFAPDEVESHAAEPGGVGASADPSADTIETEEFTLEDAGAGIAAEPEPEPEPDAEPMVELARPPARLPATLDLDEAPYELPRPALPARLQRAALTVAEAGRASVNLLRRELACSPSEAQALLDELRGSGLVDGELGTGQGRVIATFDEWQAANAPAGFLDDEPDAARAPAAPDDAGSATI